jgi:hypothetical protein
MPMQNCRSEIQGGLGNHTKYKKVCVTECLEKTSLRLQIWLLEFYKHVTQLGMPHMLFFLGLLTTKSCKMNLLTLSCLSICPSVTNLRMAVGEFF